MGWTMALGELFSMSSRASQIAVYVVQSEEKGPRKLIHCRIGQHIKFDVEKLQCYVPGPWEPIIYDTMLVAGAVEFCDVSVKRTLRYGRSFKLSIPVHEPERWNSPDTKNALLSCLRRLTGDSWEISFRVLKFEAEKPEQCDFGFEADRHFNAVIPYSDGLDSRAVAAIMQSEDPRRLMRVRVGEKNINSPRLAGLNSPFENIPFSVTAISKTRESSARSRGFKFGMLSGLAAYLLGVDAVIVPESGQGSLGPMLANVGQAHADRRTHPEFTHLISNLFKHLFKRNIRFEHPFIWNTKGQNLKRFRELVKGEAIWQETRSCWKDARQASAGGVHRQCGVCAACLLRRCSLHAAGYSEASDMYVWEDLGASSFIAGAHPSFRGDMKSARNDAIAGTLHMDHIADFGSSKLSRPLERQAQNIAEGLGVSAENAMENLQDLIKQHRVEWHEFLGAQGRSTFLKNWARST